MNTYSEEDIYKLLFAEFFPSISKLSPIDEFHLVKGSYTNLNKLKGNKSICCLFPNCKQIGAKRSHLFAETFLNIISENGKAYTKNFYSPNISAKIPQYNIEEIGIKETMTFPGFCSHCEQKFSYEKRKKLKTSNDFFLQLFRSVCYEKRIIETQIDLNNKIIDRIAQKSAQKLNNLLNFEKDKFTSIKGNSDIGILFNKKNRQLNSKLKTLNKIYQKFILAYNGSYGMNIFHIPIPARLPVFAEYIGNVKFNKDVKKFTSEIILNIHPVSSNTTEVFFTDIKNNIDYNFIRSLSIEELNDFLLSMIVQSNSWIINKSYWNNELTQNTKDQILKVFVNKL